MSEPTPTDNDPRPVNELPPDSDLPPGDHDLGAAGDRDDDDDHDQELSFEELGQAYAQALAETGDSVDQQATEGELGGDDRQTGDGRQTDDDRQVGDWHTGDDEPPPTPLAIIEAALFIGTPDNRAISEQELAALMRDVTPADVQQYVARLNESYVANGQALRIYSDADGLRMSISPDMELVRRSFYGKIRETRLSQHAIEVLSLVAYQPGITAERVQQQRGKESLSILNQLVRRRLLEQQRTPVEGSKKPLVTYQPSERFLQLFGLDSLADLPQVDG